MNERNRKSNDFDKIAGSRLSKIDGGIPIHVALSNRASITLRNKLNRLGLEGEHIQFAIKMVDEIGIQETLMVESIGVKFATIPQSKSIPKIYSP